MRKIPTIFERSDDRTHVVDRVTPGCEWVFAGEGIATRKYDGTCVLIRRDGLAVHAFARREVKPGKQPPDEFFEVETDPVTGKTVGWEPAEQSGFAKFIAEGIRNADGDLSPGTYELCGPKINGNPEVFERHVLISHATALRYPELDHPATYAERLGAPMAVASDYEIIALAVGAAAWEGIVWHHPDGRMAKIKHRDFKRRSP